MCVKHGRRNAENITIAQTMTAIIQIHVKLYLVAIRQVVEIILDVMGVQQLRREYSGKDYGTEVDPEYGIAKEQFAWLWDSTIKKADLDCYGWDANPRVWVIEFERCEKPAGPWD